MVNILPKKKKNKKYLTKLKLCDIIKIYRGEGDLLGEGKKKMSLQPNGIQKVTSLQSWTPQFIWELNRKINHLECKTLALPTLSLLML